MRGKNCLAALLMKIWPKRPEQRSYKMTYCWEVYNNSKCETCKHFIAFQSGALNLDEVKDIVVVDDDN